MLLRGASAGGRSLPSLIHCPQEPVCLPGHFTPLPPADPAEGKGSSPQPGRPGRTLGVSARFYVVAFVISFLSIYQSLRTVISSSFWRCLRNTRHLAFLARSSPSPGLFTRFSCDR